MDNIFYCSDITKLKQELKDNGMYDAETDAYTHGNDLTPIVYNGVESLALVRDNKLDLSKFPSLTNLGTYEEVFADAQKLAIYKSVHLNFAKNKYIGSFA